MILIIALEAGREGGWAYDVRREDPPPRSRATGRDTTREEALESALAEARFLAGGGPG